MCSVYVCGVVYVWCMSMCVVYVCRVVYVCGMCGCVCAFVYEETTKEISSLTTFAVCCNPSHVLTKDSV